MKALNLILITSGKISEATAHIWVVSISGDNASRVYSKSPYKAMRYAFLLKKRTGLNISDNNTEVEYESETSSLSYSFARHLTQALQSHKLYLISPNSLWAVPFLLLTSKVNFLMPPTRTTM